MKYVIYKNLKGYCVTTEENYHAKIIDKRKVTNCSRFNSANEIIKYYCEYCNCDFFDFFVVDE